MRHLLFSLPGLASVRSYTAVFGWRPRSTRSFCSSAQLASSTYSNYAVVIPVGNSGQITLQITHPDELPLQNGSVIIHLPPGPLFTQPEIAERETYETSKQCDHGAISSGKSATSLSLAQDLASSTLSTIVTINYRLGYSPSPSREAQKPASNSVADAPTSAEPASPEKVLHQYPTPVHDTLAGFDWIHQYLRPKRLGVIGAHIGGSLAIMLSLTEAQSIHAVAALEPVCDWTGLDEHCLLTMPDATDSSPATMSTAAPAADAKTPKKRTSVGRTNTPPTAPHDLIPLLKARRLYFTASERYFDAFASPILFLRSAGKDVPRTFPEYLIGPEYPIPVLQPKTSQEIFEESIYKYYPSLSDSSMSALSAHSESPTTSPPLSPMLAYLSQKAAAAAAAAATAEEEYRDDEETNQTAIRRRKSVSRWPPYGLDYGISGPAVLNHPNRGVKRLDVTLPWVRVFARGEAVKNAEPGVPAPAPVKKILAKRKSTVARRKTHTERVLAQQAVDMVDIMQRACFWGREKGFGESRVTLVRVGEGTWPTSAERYAGEWLRDVMMEIDNAES
ncbi:hypothetical protein BO82DRAFT_275723 [Aspergillus uvarum CBS 121591]|uniref:Alpha/beta hydrolase fold-3 domain-containing protein n=1 Tax=Aspergillus uvarum CBS 121591 TaxID=1448315 RepID=A0A319CIH7_9EURO|nr:hypothetical protein BO82DRAFT_275723 [Aspergillus uvarum CBS 121591]PYH84974.1 hypothetical protein BO82DRAFT_275723 [Aspergillus uvarum CBS 121591]